MNPNDEKQNERLRKAMERSFRALDPFRATRKRLIKEYVGHNYGDEKRAAVMVNLMHQTAEIYTLSLAANRPRFLVTTPHQQLLPMAANFKIALNNLIQEIRAELTIREMVLDAFFSIGIGKVCTTDGFEVQLEAGQYIDQGRPFFGKVQLGNFVFDMGATRWDRIQFAGDRYRVPLEALKASGRVDPKVIDDLRATSKYGNGSTTDDKQKAERIAIGEDIDEDEYEPHIDLWDVWLPRERKVVTYQLAETKNRPLSVVDWDGADTGPYPILRFGDVPDEIMPAAPASQLEALHLFTNRLMRKLSKQSGRQKDITAYEPGASEDMRKINQTNDGDTVAVSDVNKIAQLKFGGADQGNIAMFLSVKQLFSDMAGNLNTLAGLGASSDTVGQDQIIQGNVSQKIAKMGERVTEVTVEVGRALGQILWQNPDTMLIPGTRQIEGTNIKVDATWPPVDTDGNPIPRQAEEFYRYNFAIEPYSMAYQSPQQRMAKLVQILTGVYMPSLPMMAESGATIDWQEVNELFAEYENLPEVQRILKFGQPPPDKPGPVGGSHERQMPVNTTRTNVRVNRSGATREGQDRVMQQLMAGGNPQADEQARMMRTVG